MSKKINFIVKNKTTLELAEDANKGDIIDLANANQIDEKNLEEVIDKKAWDKAEEIANVEILKKEKDFEAEKARLLTELKNLKEQKLNEIKATVLEEKTKIQQANADKIAQLEKELAISKNAIELEVSKVEQANAKKIQDLELINVKLDSKLKETEAQWQHRFISTKSYGEELEQTVYQEFELAQQHGAFPNAKFWKDNEVISSGEGLKGTKGDFVFKDYDDNGNEILSIEIEVKTEQSTDAKTKTHNKDHYKKLNDDRIKKGCEYAILISELEKNNKCFDGIYKVRDYQNMYVVRPQSFLGFISILKDSLNKNHDLIVKLNQHDVKIKNKKQFIDNLKAFKEGFDISKIKWEKHLDGIETTIQDAIDELQETLDHIRQSRNALSTGQGKLDKLTLKRLLKDCTSEDDVFDTEEDQE